MPETPPGEITGVGKGDVRSVVLVSNPKGFFEFRSEDRGAQPCMLSGARNIQKINSSKKGVVKNTGSTSDIVVADQLIGDMGLAQLGPSTINQPEMNFKPTLDFPPLNRLGKSSQHAIILKQIISKIRYPPPLLRW